MVFGFQELQRKEKRKKGGKWSFQKRLGRKVVGSATFRRETVKAVVGNLERSQRREIIEFD